MVSVNKPPSTVQTIVNRAPWWVPWLFIVIALGGFAIYQFYGLSTVADTNRDARVLIRHAQVEACERHNILREEFNARSTVLERHLTAAAEDALTREQREIASTYLSLAREVNTVPLTNCQEAFPEDIARAGFTP